MKNKNLPLFLAGIVLGVVQFPSNFLTCFRYFLQTGNSDIKFLQGGNLITINLCDLLGRGILIVYVVIIVFMIFLWREIRAFGSDTENGKQ